VRRGQSMGLVALDGVHVTIDAPSDGVIERLLHLENETVPFGAPVAIIQDQHPEDTTSGNYGATGSDAGVDVVCTGSDQRRYDRCPHCGSTFKLDKASYARLVGAHEKVIEGLKTDSDRFRRDLDDVQSEGRRIRAERDTLKANLLRFGLSQRRNRRILGTIAAAAAVLCAYTLLTIARPDWIPWLDWKLAGQIGVSRKANVELAKQLARATAQKLETGRLLEEVRHQSEELKTDSAEARRQLAAAQLAVIKLRETNETMQTHAQQLSTSNNQLKADNARLATENKFLNARFRQSPPRTSRECSGSDDEQLGQGLTRYLQTKRPCLPNVRASVKTESNCDRTVHLMGCARTGRGKDDAEHSARSFLQDPNAEFDDDIEVEDGLCVGGCPQ